MSNVSDCRFQNTYGDVLECLGALGQESPLSSDEYRAALSMFQAFLCFCVDEDIIEGFDTGRLKEYLSELHKGRN